MTVHVECTLGRGRLQEARGGFGARERGASHQEHGSASRPGSTWPSPAMSPRSEGKAKRAWSTTGEGLNHGAGPSPRTTKPSSEAILHTAATFFAEHGFDRAPMGRLAEACERLQSLDLSTIIRPRMRCCSTFLDTHLTALVEVVEAAASEPGHAAIAAAGIESRRSCRLPGIPMPSTRCNSRLCRRCPEDNQRHLRALQRRLVTHMSEAVRAIEPERFARPAGPLVGPVTMSVFGMLSTGSILLAQAGRADRPRRLCGTSFADLVIGGLPKVCE